MKKTLSVILSAVLLLGVFGVAATAAPDRSLQFNPPMIEDIEVSWNGDILLAAQWFGASPQARLVPIFSPDNLDITVAFADGTSEVLENWRGEFWTGNGNSFGWEVRFVYNMDDNQVTVSLHCSRLRDAAVEEAGGWNYVDWADVFPNDTFNIPEDFVDEFFAQQASVTALVLAEESAAFSGQRIFSFTAPENRAYRVGWSDSWGNLLIINAQREIITSTYGSPVRVFEAGETYYIIATPVSPQDGDAQIIVIEADMPQPWRPTFHQRWRDWTSGWMRQLQHSVLGRIVSLVLAPIIIVLDIPIRLISWIIHGNRW